MAFRALSGGVSGHLLAPKEHRRENREVLQNKIGRIKNRVRRNHGESEEELPEALALRDADYLH